VHHPAPEAKLIIWASRKAIDRKCKSQLYGTSICSADPSEHMHMLHLQDLDLLGRPERHVVRLRKRPVDLVDLVVALMSEER